MNLDQAIAFLGQRENRLVLNFPMIVGIDGPFWTALRTVAWAAIEERDRMKDSEEAIVTAAQALVSETNWKLGELAARWQERYARGRTLTDFAAWLGNSRYLVEDSAHVHIRFSAVRGNYPELRFGHFYAALRWDNAEECLAWANETRSTVAEMRAWRRAMRGEDLTIDDSEDA